MDMWERARNTTTRAQTLNEQKLEESSKIQEEEGFLLDKYDTIYCTSNKI